MKKTSVFDVIGPVMIGPSSSHTAGALRIALVASKIFKSNIDSAVFTLYGSFAKTYRGHGTDRALLGGIMGFNTEDARIKDSFGLADQKGIKYTFIEGEENKELHPNTVKIDIKGDNKELSIMGESIGGGSIVITQINGIDVKFTGEYTSIIVQQIDKPGVAAHITNVLMNENINIAFMSIFRESKGEKAFTVLEIDNNVDEGITEKLANHENIINVFLISM